MMSSAGVNFNLLRKNMNMDTHGMQHTGDSASAASSSANPLTSSALIERYLPGSFTEVLQSFYGMSLSDVEQTNLLHNTNPLMGEASSYGSMSSSFSNTGSFIPTTTGHYLSVPGHTYHASKGDSGSFSDGHQLYGLTNQQGIGANFSHVPVHQSQIPAELGGHIPVQSQFCTAQQVQVPGPQYMTSDLHTVTQIPETATFGIVQNVYSTLPLGAGSQGSSYQERFLNEGVESLYRNLPYEQHVQLQQGSNLPAEMSSIIGSTVANTEQSCINLMNMLVHIRHACICGAPEGNCDYYRCTEAKELLNHVANCKSSSCSFPYCYDAQYATDHYSKCRECSVCVAYRSLIGQSASAHLHSSQLGLEGQQGFNNYQTRSSYIAENTSFLPLPYSTKFSMGAGSYGSTTYPSGGYSGPLTDEHQLRKLLEQQHTVAYHQQDLNQPPIPSALNSHVMPEPQTFVQSDIYTAPHTQKFASHVPQFDYSSLHLGGHSEALRPAQCCMYEDIQSLEGFFFNAKLQQGNIAEMPITFVPTVANPEQLYKELQDLVLHMHHGCRCRAPTGRCRNYAQCSRAQELVKHASCCKDSSCSYIDCDVAKSLAHHYRNCGKCSICLFAKDLTAQASSARQRDTHSRLEHRSSYEAGKAKGKEKIMDLDSP